MKTTIFNKKAPAFFGAAALLFAAVFTIGCKTEISSSDPAPETFTVEMKAGEHGTLTANPAIPTSGKVAKDTVITFTANPTSGYKVDKWTITGGTFESGTGTEGSLTAKVKISANTKVNVSFKAEVITPPSPTEFTVQMEAGEHGTLTASPAIPANGKVAKDTVITFTANPASGYKVDKWTITGGTFESGTGTEGSPTAKVKISANTKVNVSFKEEAITPPSPTEFTVQTEAGEHGSLTASPAIPTSGKVAKDTVLTFTANPTSGYKVDKWTITGGTFETGTGSDGSTTAKVKISANTKVSVSFKAEVITPPSPTEFTVQTEAGEHGTLTASPAIPTSGKVAKDTVITFTAVPATGYKVDKWTITGGTFETGTGSDGSTTAKVKITANTKVAVSFKADNYNTVSFANLNTYLQTASSTDINYIKVTELTAADLKGDGDSEPMEPSPLGKILNDNPSKKAALELEEIPGLTNMSCCFLGCTSLTQAPAIPNSVTNMEFCFAGCTSLTQAPEIPSSVTNMGFCFDGCTSLTQAPVIQNGVTNMYCCFRGCTSLIRAPAIPSSVTDMSYCFSGCTSLTQAPVIQNGVTDMANCFSGCTSLTQAPEIPSSVTNMYCCFSHCKNLTQAPVIPSSVTNMRSCFIGCTSLTQASVIPSSVTNMENCFYGCTSLTQVPVIPSSVTNMESCFYDCTSLTQAPEIPSSVTNMHSCFDGCTSLTQAPVIQNGVTDMYCCFRGCTSLTQAPAISNSVTNMQGCFRGCTSLTQAPVIPSSVTDMRYCFEYCKKITTITLKCNYVAGEFSRAFAGCENLTANSIKVPAGQLQTYKDNASIMGTEPDRFVAE